VFAFGVLLHYMLTQETVARDYLMIVRGGMPPLPKTIKENSRWSNILEIYYNCLKFNPKDRFTAQQALNKLP
jgi:hypothetical protein